MSSDFLNITKENCDNDTSVNLIITVAVGILLYTYLHNHNHSNNHKRIRKNRYKPNLSQNIIFSVVIISIMLSLFTSEDISCNKTQNDREDINDTVQHNNETECQLQSVAADKYDEYESKTTIFRENEYYGHRVPIEICDILG